MGFRFSSIFWIHNNFFKTFDRFLGKICPGISFGRFQKAFRKGEIRLNGKRVEATYRLKAGDILRLPPHFKNFSDEQLKALKTYKPFLKLSSSEVKDFEDRILYEDEDILVWNKPYGLAVQGGTKTRKHLDAILDALVDLGRYTKALRPRLVHRLDRDTSGVLVLGKSQEAASFLTQAFAQKEILKLYWAIVVGKLPHAFGKIKLSLSKKAIKGLEKIVVDPEDGRESETHYRVLDIMGDKLSWVGLRPLTGRMHQLRVHCSYLQTPILGDGKYRGEGNKTSKIEGFSHKMHLHAREIQIPHPKGGIKKFKAPLPAHMKDTLDTLGFDENSPKILKNCQQLFQEIKPQKS